MKDYSSSGQPSTNIVAFDGNGNVAALVNATNGSMAAQYEYGPFGELLRATGPMAKVNPFRFSTKYQDDETDLLYYGYRYYNASTGRWLNWDPLEEAGGYNLYAFSKNDPVGLVDIVGLSTSFKVVGKSYIAPITSFIGSVPGGNQDALATFAYITDQSYSEIVNNDAKDEGYRLYSEEIFTVDCCGSGKLSVSASALVTDSGREPYRNGPVKVSPLTVVFDSVSIGTSVRFSWKVRGRPEKIFENPFTLVKRRTGWYIWHQIDGTISCENGFPKVTVNITGSAFPSHIVFLNNVGQSTKGQGNFSGLWSYSASDPVEIR